MEAARPILHFRSLRHDMSHEVSLARNTLSFFWTTLRNSVSDAFGTAFPSCRVALPGTRPADAPDDAPYMTIETDQHAWAMTNTATGHLGGRVPVSFGYGALA